MEISTQSKSLLELIGIRGELPTELPTELLSRLNGSDTYKEKVITTLKNDGDIKINNKTNIKGYRLSSVAKKKLLLSNYLGSNFI